MDHEPPGSLARCSPFVLGQELTYVSQFGLGSARSGSACPRACSSRWRRHSRSTPWASSPSSGSLAVASAAGLVGRHMHPGMEIMKFVQILEKIGKWWNYLLIEGIKRSALFWTLLLLVFFIVSHVLRRNVLTFLLKRLLTFLIRQILVTFAWGSCGGSFVPLPQHWRPILIGKRYI